MNNRTRSGIVGMAFAVLATVCGSDEPRPVGGSCTADDGCATGLSCNLGVPGGYCTRACTTAGQTAECPERAVCDVVEGKGILCVQICETHMDCRAGLDCNGVKSTNIKACKPKGEAPDAGTDGKKP